MKSPTAHSSLLFISLFVMTLISLYISWMDFENLLLSTKHGQYLQSSRTEVPISIAENVAMVVKADTPHYGLSSDLEWDSLLPSGEASGFVRLDASSYPFDPSLYHQLHCLNNLRKIYMGPGWEGDDRKDWHIKHCLNMILRAVLCNADTTLEPSFESKLPDGRIVPGASGDNVVHQCRDWTIVRSFSENNYRTYKDVPFGGR